MVNRETAFRVRALNVTAVSGDFVPRNPTRTVPQLELRQAVEEAYLGVFLLTGDVELAEIAVTACIEDPTEALALRAVRLALQLQFNGSEQTASNTSLDTGALPTELNCVLRLPSHLRHGFVLRFLAGIPLPICEDILQMESEYISASTGTAALELALAVSRNAALSGC
jgi:hypothetical protein